LPGVEQHPLAGLARGVADHARAAADDDDRTTAGTLKVREQEHLQQVSHVQGRGAGVETDVGADGTGSEPLLQPFRRQMDQAAPAELVEQQGVGHAIVAVRG